jgi:hypothetical protein
MSTRAWVHGRGQHELGGEGDGASCPRDRHDAVFQRLTKHLQHAHAELGQLVEKENAAVGQTNLARAGPAAAADEADVADRVVGRAERARLDQRRAARQPAADAIDLRDLDGLVLAHGWEDGG